MVAGDAVGRIPFLVVRTFLSAMAGSMAGVLTYLNPAISLQQKMWPDSGG